MNDSFEKDNIIEINNLDKKEQLEQSNELIIKTIGAIALDSSVSLALGINYDRGETIKDTPRGYGQFKEECDLYLEKFKTKDEIDNLKISTITDSFSVGNNLLQAIKSNSDYISSGSVSKLMSSLDSKSKCADYYNAEHNFSSKSEIVDLVSFDLKNKLLYNFYYKLLNRSKIGDIPFEKDKRNTIYELEQRLKSDFIMEFNDLIRDEIIKNNPTRLELINKLNVCVKDPSEIKTRLNILMKQRYGDIFNTVISGMKHEIAFEDLINQINNEYNSSNNTNINEFEVIKSNRQDDLKGSDLKLKVNVVYENNENRYRYASIDEIINGISQEIVLPIDIKSTKLSAENTIDGLKKKDHWSMWSHVYNGDFNFKLDSNGALRSSSEAKNETLRIKKELFDFMKTPEYGRISYEDSVNSGNVYPDSYDERADDVRVQVLNGINYVYAKSKK